MEKLGGFIYDFRTLGMSYGDEFAEDLELFVLEDAKIPRTMDLAWNKVYITTANENPEATIRWINEILEKENMHTLYSGPQTTEEEVMNVAWAWYYDKDGKVQTGGHGDATKYYILGTNGLRFTPGMYRKETQALDYSNIEKYGYEEISENMGIIQTYSNDYMDICKFDAEVQDRISGQLRVDIDTIKKEFTVEVLKNGMDDDKWHDFVARLEDAGYEEYVQYYADALAKINVK